MFGTKAFLDEPLRDYERDERAFHDRKSKGVANDGLTAAVKVGKLNVASLH